MGRGLRLSRDLMQTWRTRLCRLCINQHPKVAIVGQRRRGGERLQKQINLSRERLDKQNCSFSKHSKIATKIQVYEDDSPLHSQSDLDTATSTGRQAEKKERQQEASPNNPLKLKINVEKDQLDRNEKQPFDSTPRDEDSTERDQ